jgi:2-iminobutanoate/2-iminopropanoate deaminase
MRRAFNSETAPPPAGPYSHAVRVGDLVFLAGQGPVDPATGQIPSSFEEQVRQVLSNLQAATEAAGASLTAAVNVRVYLRDMADFDVMNRVYREFFSEPYPVRTTIQSDIPIDVEIDAIVVAGDD